jgi:hypothetical protein
MSSSKLRGRGLTLRPGIVVAALQNGAVLLDLDTKYFYSVNCPGWAIVQMLESGVTIDQAQARCQTWGCTAEDGEAIENFIGTLLNEKLVEAVNSQQRPPDIVFEGPWLPPVIEKHKEPLQRIMTSAFDPSIPLAE